MYQEKLRIYLIGGVFGLTIFLMIGIFLKHELGALVAGIYYLIGFLLVAFSIGWPVYNKYKSKDKPKVYDVKRGD